MSEPYPGLLPVGAFTLEITPDLPQPAMEAEGTIRITLAAIDPEDAKGNEPSTLRIIRRVYNNDDDELVSYPGDEDEDDEDEEEEEETPKKKSPKKAAKAAKDEEELEDASEEDWEDDEDYEISRTVICTLSPKTSYQQTLDIVINASEDVVFEVTGSYPIHLTGNHVLHPMDEDSEDDSEDDSEADYDLSPDEDELDFSNRVQELPESEDEEEEPTKPEPKQKNNKKRAVEETPVVETKTKKQKKAADKAEDKKVAFTKELEQGPTGSTSSPAAKKGPTSKKLAGGVTIEDRKTGAGPTAQPGDKVSVRYIGKLLNGTTFDSNTKGKPFAFKLGAGEVIKGWDVGVAGMSVKGERRIVIPAGSAYGKKALPGIPPNSTLTFDVKLVGIK